MLYRTLGNTGLKVSAAGLGSGGASKLGLGKVPEADVIALIHLTLDLGVNFIDTAPLYGTEPVVGKALATVPRDQVVLATKAVVADQKTGELMTPEQVVAGIENSLRLLQTDHVDLLQLHNVSPSNYHYARDEIYPAVLREKAKGRLRFIGITENANIDTNNQMMRLAVADHGIWDTGMASFNLMKQGARTAIFADMLKQRIGALVMNPIRGSGTYIERLRTAFTEMQQSRTLPAWVEDMPDPLGFLTDATGGSLISDVGYRFVRDEPGVDVVLFGTGDTGHLRANVATFSKPPLSAAERDLLILLGEAASAAGG